MRESLGICPVCGRAMFDGASVDRHHWVPRSEGGAEAEWLHRVCHRMIHRVFGEKELAQGYPDAATVRAHPEIARFVAWVRKKPPEYVDWPRLSAGERKGGKR